MADKPPMLDTLDDRQLVEAARRNPDAFGVLFHRYFAPVYRLVSAHARDQAQAEQVTEEVFFNALRELKRYRPARQRFFSWLRGIALMSLSARGLKIRPDRREPRPDRGYQSTGRPAPIRPQLPTLSAAAAVPLPPTFEGPGIVYALGR
jgi:sigma-70-like protein